MKQLEKIPLFYNPQGHVWIDPEAVSYVHKLHGKDGATVLGFGAKEVVTTLSEEDVLNLIRRSSLDPMARVSFDRVLDGIKKAKKATKDHYCNACQSTHSVSPEHHCPCGCGAAV